MTSLFLPVSMTTGRYAARPRHCLRAFFASDTTILRKLTIHSENQAKEKNGHFQYLAYFHGFIPLKVILLSLLSTRTMTCPFKILLSGIVSTLMRASDIELPHCNWTELLGFCLSQLTLVRSWASFLIFLILMSLFIK